MRAAFFRASVEGELSFIAFAKTRDPEEEFRLLVAEDTGHINIIKAYGSTPPPTLDQDCVLGMGRDEEEARQHIVLKAQEMP